MGQDIQRIGVGRNRFPGINETDISPNDGTFSFDSKEVTFDNISQTFDQDVVVVPVIIPGDYSNNDYSIDYLI
jgi:hypothetical protein